MTDALQPPPRQCQFCGVDLDVAYHKPTCRILTGDDLQIPAFLRRGTAGGEHPDGLRALISDNPKER